MIKRDMARGRLFAQDDPTGFDQAWMSTLSGGGRLLLVTEPDPLPAGVDEAYRAEFDSSYTRYYRMSDGTWEAYATDGTVFRFGELAYGGAAHTEWLPLTTVQDAFGNTTAYNWGTVDVGPTDFGVDVYLDSIDYSSNANAGLSSYARVVFAYVPATACAGSDIPTGAAVDFKYSDATEGALVRGSQLLDEIRTEVYEGTWRPVRTYDLSYTETPCSGTLESPVRRLTSITESGRSPAGVWTFAPTVTFGYGPRAMERTEPISVEVGGPSSDSLTWGKANHSPSTTGDYPASILGQYIDFYGSGQPQLETPSKVGSSCLVGSFSMPTIPFPGTHGFTEQCTIGYQSSDVDNRGLSWPFQGSSELLVRHWSYLEYHFVDVDADRLLDVVTVVREDKNFYLASLDAGLAQYDPSPDPPCYAPDQSERVNTGQEECYPDPLAERRFINRWYRNNGVSFVSPQIFTTGVSINGQNGQAFSDDLPDVEPPPSDNEMEGKQWRWYTSATQQSAGQFTDFDGDSFPDIIDGSGLQRGGPGGVFSTQSDGSLYNFTGVDGKTVMGTKSKHDVTLGTSRTVGRLVDINGDGLVDFVGHEDISDDLLAYYNQGTGFSPNTIHLRNAADPSLDYLTMDLPDPPATSTREYEHRTLDFDGDGLVDFLRNDGGVLKVRWNTGGDWTTAETTLSSSYLEAFKQRAYDGGGYWGITTDITDVNGDGFPDIVSAPSPLSVPTASAANAGVLEQIENGYGQTVSVNYAFTHDASVVTGSLSRVGRQRVVQSITVEDFFSETSDGTTSYVYSDAEVNPDDYSRWNFRGFSSVRTTSPTGAVTIDAFDYSDDFRGRLVESAVYLSAADADITPVGNSLPVSVSTRDWSTYSALGVTVYQNDLNRDYTCQTGQTKDDCLATGSVRTQETVFAQDQSFILWWPLQQRDYAGTTFPGPGARETQTVHTLYTGGSSYLLRADRTGIWLGAAEADVEQRAWDEGVGAMAMLSQRENIFSADYRLLEQQHVNVARPGDPDTWAVTDYTYDTDTGNLVKRVKPEQYENYGPTGPSTTYAYDLNKVFVASTTNELGHVVDTVTDLGTGVVVHAFGPNSKDVGQGPVKEEVEVVIDGLARPIQTWVTVDDAAQGYRKELVEKITYTNPSGGQIPATKLVERLIDYGVDEWVTDLYEIDGTGRVFEVTSYHFGEATDGLTHFYYDELGKVETMTVPDPSSPGGPTVTYQYLRDPLGRLTGVRNPLGTGVDIVYNGLVTTRTEFNPGAGAGDPIASRIAYRNALGQITRVEEKLSPGWAATDYTYHGERLVHVADPDGVTTSLEYDLGGRRFKITHGAAHPWLYRYDLNGNMEGITSPNPAGEGDPNYTTSIVYDDLDRVDSRDPALRNLSGSQLLQFGVGLTNTDYDVGDKGIGRVTRVEYPYGVDVDYDHDGRGNVEGETYTMDLSPSLGAEFSGVYSIARTFNALNTPTQITHADGVVTRTLYDRRGRPDRLEWSTTDGWRVLADFTRNTAGVVTNRASDFDQSQTWSYTQLGQVQNTDVVAHGTAVAGQTYGFYGMGDVQTLEHRNYSGTHTSSHTFDTRHQLATATGSLGAYAWDFTYTPGGRLNTVQLDHDGTLDAPERYVQYFYYDPSYPDAVSFLEPVVPGSGAQALYTYDQAGNRAMSQLLPTGYYGGDDELLAWHDGDNQLRSIESGSGTTRELHYYAGPGNRLLRADYDIPNDNVTKLTAYVGVTELDFDSAGNQTTTRSRMPLSGTAAARISDASDVELTYQSPLGHIIEAWGETRFAGVSTSASSFTRGYPSSNVIDGDTSTTWQTLGAESGWVSVDLGEVRQIDRITLHDPDHSIGDYELQYYFRGSWVTFASGTGILGLSKEHTFPPISAQHVRLEIHNKEPSWPYPWVSLGEIRFYDTAEQRFSAVYDAFGEELQVLDATGDHLYRFNGKERSEVSRYHYYGYRHYDPLSMVWTQGDPLYRFVPELAYNEPRRLSLYDFSLNNPLRYVDPNGQKPVVVYVGEVVMKSATRAQVKQGAAEMYKMVSGSDEKVATYNRTGADALTGFDWQGEDIVVLVIDQDIPEEELQSVHTSAGYSDADASEETKEARKGLQPGGGELGRAELGGGLIMVSGAVKTEHAKKTTKHEIGHSLGLEDTDAKGNLMSKTATEGEKLTEAQRKKVGEGWKKRLERSSKKKKKKKPSTRHIDDSFEEYMP